MVEKEANVPGPRLPVGKDSPAAAGSLGVAQSSTPPVLSTKSTRLPCFLVHTRGVTEPCPLLEPVATNRLGDVYVKEVGNASYDLEKLSSFFKCFFIDLRDTH